MPDPREAIYDVLIAKKRRADELSAIAARKEESGYGWAEYERANERANADYRGRRGK